MIKLDYLIIESYLDNIALTKQSRLDYEKQCKDIIDVIKKLVGLGYRTSSDVGAALRTVNISKFKTSITNQGESLNQLKSFLIHIGYTNDAASCAIRWLKQNGSSIHTQEIIKMLKDK